MSPPVPLDRPPARAAGGQDDLDRPTAAVLGTATLTDDLRPTVGADVRRERRQGHDTRTARARAIAGVGALFVALAAWRVALALHAGGPTVFGDELLYFRNAHSLATLGWYHDAHFPPLYPAILAPAYLTGAQVPWRAALLLSAVVGATVVPAAYWLARTAGARLPMAAALLAAVLPGTSAFSQHLMSESVGVPLVLVGFALALRGHRTPPVLMGVAAALLCLTKFLYFPLALVLVATWWWMRTRGASVTDDADRADDSPVRALGVLVLTVVLCLSAWFAYAMMSGWSMAEATGAAIVQRTASTLDVGSAVGPVSLWGTLYVSYLVAACVPAVLVAAWLLLSRGAGHRLVGVLRARTVSRRAALLLTVAVAVTGYVVVAVRHSLGAWYNLPEPDHYQGRYLMHLVPLLAVAAVVGLDMVLDRRDALRGWRPWVAALATGVVVAGAFSALFGPVFAAYPNLAGMKFPPLSPDVYPLGTPRALLGFLGLVVASAVLVALRRRLTTVLVWVAVAALGTAASFGTFLEGRGATPHKIVDLVHAHRPATGAVVVCVGPGVKPPSSGATEFWRLTTENVVALEEGIPLADLSAIFASCRVTSGTGPGDTVLYVTAEPGDLEPTLVDDRWGSSMYVFQD